MTAIAAYLRVPLIRFGLAALLLVAGTLAVSEYLVWGPERAKLAAARAELAELQDEAAALRARVDRTVPFAEMAELLDGVSARFGVGMDRAGVVARMTEISAASGTRIIHGANSFGEPRAGIAPVLQDLTVEGSYPAIGRFVDELAALETLTLIRKAEFSANPDGTLVRVKLQLMTLSAEGGA